MNHYLHHLYILILALGLLSTAAPAQDVVQADAVSGTPFGVGRVELLVDPRMNVSDATLTDRHGRVHYPTVSVSTRPVRRILRELVGAPQKVEAFFLFTGNGPLDLSLAGSEGSFRVTPAGAAENHAALLGEWWNRFASAEARESRSASYPTLVEDYLVGSLSRRLGLPMPKELVTAESGSDLQHAIRVLGGAESIRSQWIRRVALGLGAEGRANEKLPELTGLTMADPPVSEDVKIEAMANHVPPELFYVRFGSFTNYLWFSHRLNDWGGEIGSLISERSIDYGLNDRQREQLCLEESAMAEVLGPAVISDAALVGTDMFLREGAAMGILFEARNSLLLNNDINADRTDAMKANPTAVEEKLTIGGKAVSYLHTPDNRLRSYYVAIDGYHLVTTSRFIAERFIEVAKDKKSLGASAEFRHARGLFPADRGDTVFAYLSTAFLRNLISPGYQVELQRRLRSLAEMDVLGVALAEAAAHGTKDATIAELTAQGLLPRGLGIRPDGSRLDDQNGVVVDSVRGPRGMFVPVPDMPIKGVTAAEAVECVQVAEKYAASWQQLTPIVAAVSRGKGAREGLERVTLDVRLTPLAAQQYKFLASQLGAPTNQRMAPVQGDVVSVDVVLSQAMGSNGEDYHLFGGLRSIDPRILTGSTMEKLLGMFGGNEIEGYIGAWPRPGILWLLGASANLPTDEAGYSQFITGGWRRLVGKFTLMSFQPELLAEITPQLKLITADRPAQAWIKADDLKESRLAPLLNGYGYGKAVELSRGNARFLNSLSTQLQVQPAEALSVAETLLAARLVCALGGKYELVGQGNRPAGWESTANRTIDRSGAPPADYEFPALYWLRGITAEVRLTEEELAVHADLEMPVKERPAAFQLPSLGLPAKAPATKPAPKPVAPKAKANGPREF